jgi:hypothetical protein
MPIALHRFQSGVLVGERLQAPTLTIDVVEGTAFQV